ncbi:unnamed protein product [Spirodela intermedia]|uniref:Uncharacterized protein n=1 Tax=Spirodela intermedia TaxID=51605 RepID=A0A7I8JMK3_SPIIN|nr:unnamed protein product [Spirodela intermedia]CAA6671386.1 unnamed protein product [Spirodela intermedia]
MSLSLSLLRSHLGAWVLSLLILASWFGVSGSTQKIGRGYRLVAIGRSPGGEGLAGVLQVKQSTGKYGPDIRQLKFFVRHETEDRLRVYITDDDQERWEVPYDLLPESESRRRSPHPPLKLVFTYKADPFGFTVKRKSDGQILFDTNAGAGDPYNSLVFKDQYLEISTRLPGGAAIYGLGENTQPGGIRLRPNDPYTLYTTDISAINLNMDLYGSHPFYMDLRNVNGEPFAMAGTSLTYKAIGGVLDFYFFSGPTPLGVVDQYTSLIGRPAPMPYWAFGFHQCRWGYQNISVVESVVEAYQKARIPLDVIWNDDDHMDAAKDFTLDPVNYPRAKLLAFLEKIHAQGMKYIVLIDPGIAVNESYGVFVRGMAADVFIKYGGKPYLAQVWPGPVYFPDFLSPSGVSWWVDEIDRFHELVPVDGLWIDMNEVSNFCTGQCEMPTAAHPCPMGRAPVQDQRVGEPGPAGFKTIATSATHYGGVLEYNAHSLYGFSQAVATRRALQGLQGKRPFILTRSTFVGSGALAAHWTGDNKGTWEDLRYSISTMLNFGIFGMPMVGSDICGFYPAPTEELCNRWIELGAFYPFSRDHSNLHSPRQELYLWDSVAASARNALGLRYRLLPYLYTLSYEAHTTGAPIARPLFFSFPNFTEAYGLSTQFLLGRGGDGRQGAVPPGTWYNLFDLRKAVSAEDGQYVTLDAPLNEINVHEARATPFTLVVAFPLGAAVGEASGGVFVDDDERPEMKLEDGQSTYATFYATLQNGTVRVWSDVAHGSFALQQELIIEKVTLVGVSGAGRGLSIEVDGEALSDLAGARFLELNPRSLMVEIGGLALPLGKNFSLTWRMEIGS